MRNRIHHSLVAAAQDGYTLERVDVYGRVDGVHEPVVTSSAECYVARNDNPSFSASRPLLLFSSSSLLHNCIYTPCLNLDLD